MTYFNPYKESYMHFLLTFCEIYVINVENVHQTLNKLMIFNYFNAIVERTQDLQKMIKIKATSSFNITQIYDYWYNIYNLYTWNSKISGSTNDGLKTMFQTPYLPK